MEKSLFYFSQNRILSRVAPALIFVLCCFWSIYDIATGDPMYFIKTGAIYGIIAMAVASVLEFCVVMSVEKTEKADITDDRVLEDKLHTWCYVTTFYYMVIITVASIICGANSYTLYLSGASVSLQSISLSSALLLIPTIIPLPEKKYGFALLPVLVLAPIIPFHMLGSSSYSVLPEIVLRAAMVVGYTVIYLRMENNYVLEMKFRNGNKKMLAMLVNLIELRSLESGKHVSIVRNYTRIMLKNMKEKYPEYDLTESMINTIADASATHDIGKILIPDNILLKPGTLSPDEFEVMKTHTEKGKAILDELPEEFLGTDYIKYSKEICMYHHEKYDGNGYPQGLKGEEIPLWAQVVSIVDCYEALTGERCYKEAYSHDTAIRMILDGECGAFSERIINCLLDCADSFRNLAAENM